MGKRHLRKEVDCVTKEEMSKRRRKGKEPTPSEGPSKPSRVLTRGKAKSLTDYGKEDPYYPVIDMPQRQYYIFTHNATRIYLTPFDEFANDASWLRSRKIRYIVNVSQRPNVFEKEAEFYKDIRGTGTGQIKIDDYIPVAIQYKKVNVKDQDDDREAKKLKKLLPETLEFIENATRAWGPNETEKRETKLYNEVANGKDHYGVLIHCNEGRCRSAAVLIAFMVTYQPTVFNLASAYLLLRSKVPNLNINASFLRMLRRYEEQSKGWDYGDTTFPDASARMSKTLSPYYRDLERERRLI